MPRNTYPLSRRKKCRTEVKVSYIQIRKPLFPGYVFIQTGIEPGLIAGRLAMALRNVKDVY